MLRSLSLQSPQPEHIWMKGTLASLQHLANDFSFGDPFLEWTKNRLEAIREENISDIRLNQWHPSTSSAWTLLSPSGCHLGVIDLVCLGPHSPKVSLALPTTHNHNSSQQQQQQLFHYHLNVNKVHQSRFSLSAWVNSSHTFADLCVDENLALESALENSRG
ncbi:hypothetical protein Tco_0842810 [Tanacetum coccineum]|uniref:Uncharacterized protein n=1 Tax=Tanacetum coccineum TaxID=301880 RepID=A0ABQ5B1I6_9ASTR